MFYCYHFLIVYFYNYAADKNLFGGGFGRSKKWNGEPAYNG
jgi:hypothetical protein